MIDISNHTLTDAHSYCAYRIKRDGVTLWVGVCKYADVLNPPDLQRASAALDLVSAAPVGLEVVTISTDRAECVSDADGMIERERPAGNAHAPAPGNARRRGVLRRSDGARWPSVREAAEAAGVAPASMSSHLQRRAGYMTLKGETYERVSDA
jgi:hypothetical protein